MNDTIGGIDIWLYQLRIIYGGFLRRGCDLEMVSLDGFNCMRGEYRTVANGGGDIRSAPESNDSDQRTPLSPTA